MKNNLLKQRHIEGLGALVESFLATLPLLSAINFVSIMIILYSNIRPYLLEHIPWVTLPLYFAFVTVLTLTGMLLVFKYLIPSIWTFRQSQMFGFKSNISGKLDKLIELLEKENAKKDK